MLNAICQYVILLTIILYISQFILYSDPYAPIRVQASLFENLGRGVDRTWSIIADADHAVHLSDERHRFVENISNFLGNTLE